MRSFRFALVMENSNVKGYVTEKIANAFMASTIPIYYGTTDIFKLFNKDAFIYYDIHDPQPALDRIAYLETNRTAYAEVLAQPILVNGERTLEEYFSLSDDVGGGKLKKRIWDMVFGSTNAAEPQTPPSLHDGQALPMANGERTPEAAHVTLIQYGSGNYKLDKPTGKVPGSYSWSQSLRPLNTTNPSSL